MRLKLLAGAALAASFSSGAAVAGDPVEIVEETAEVKPLIEGELEVGLATDWTFRSDDPTAEIVDLYPEAALGFTLNATQWLAFNLGLTLEPVLDPLPSTDRYFGDLGLYVDTLNFQIEHSGFTLVGGKFGPGFGTAWDVTPGVYGTDFAEDYELSEMIGTGASYGFDAGSAGTITLGGNVFFMDNTFFSESGFTQRGRNSVAAGGPGNTGRLNNFSFTLDGSDIPSIEGFGWHLGYVHLEAGVGDVSDVDGFAAGIARETGLANGMTLGWNGELAWFNGANGADDKAFYATAGLSLASGPWHGELAATFRQTRYFGGGRDNDLLAQLSGGYEFENGVDLSLGYAFAREAGVNNHTLGLRMSRTFNFELPR